MEQLIDIRTAATLLGLREPTIRKYVMLRVLPYRKLGTRVLFSPSELEGWANERRVPTLDERSDRRHRREPSKASA
jgi:excisionase family DNA binding protein